MWCSWEWSEKIIKKSQLLYLYKTLTNQSYMKNTQDVADIRKSMKQTLTFI